jgi:hypothetical protein
VAGAPSRVLTPAVVRPERPAAPPAHGPLRARPPTLHPRRAPLHRPPFIHQAHPAGAAPGYDGSANCGPTCFAMISRVLGYRRDLGDAALVEHLGAVGATNLDIGTTLDGMKAIGAAVGCRVEITPGAALEPMLQALAAGQLVIANGEYYVMPPHEDPSRREGHYVLVYGLTPEGFLVHDPDDAAVHVVRRDDMARFLAEHHEGGFTLTVTPSPHLSAVEQFNLHRPRPPHLSAHLD